MLAIFFIIILKYFVFKIIKWYNLIGDSMIEIKNLTKVFKSKNKSVVVALNDINLTLPDSGLVFIIGKSGSGKSTLLNMLERTF